MPKKKASRTLKPSMPPIVEMPIGDIRPYENNPRFNEDAVPYVAESLKEFGWQQPIVIDKGGEIVAGHTRFLAAKSLGMKSVPCVMASSLTPEQIRAYRLVDNKTNEFASWDSMKLDPELDALPMFDMSKYGFVLSDGDDVADAFADNGDDAEVYRDVDKVAFKIPVEFLERVRKWLREGGRKKTIRFILEESGCIEEAEPLPEGVGDEDEEE